MSDAGDLYREMRYESQKRRAHNRRSSAQLLRERSIAFESRNNGAHLIVSHRDKVLDLWPGTGRWRDRKGKGGFGVRNLLAYIEREQ
jgi:hypothetical protein